MMMMLIKMMITMMMMMLKIEAMAAKVMAEIGCSLNVWSS